MIEEKEFDFLIDKVHSTKMGIERIKTNMKLENDDVVTYIKKLLQKKDRQVIRKGKNYYVLTSGYVITINASSYTIITVHPFRSKDEENFNISD